MKTKTFKWLVEVINTKNVKKVEILKHGMYPASIRLTVKNGAKYYMDPDELVKIFKASAVKLQAEEKRTRAWVTVKK